MRSKLAKAELQIAAIAARQHGVITLAQLAGLGFDRAAVARRVRSGRLHRIHRGAYAVSHPNLSREGRWFAAVATFGRTAVLSHESAACLWQLSPPESPSWVHVTIPGSNGRARRRGIVLHRSTTLTRSDVTRRRNIPVTTLDRTRRDLGYGPEPTRSGLERAFLRLLEEHKIPTPETNARVGPYLVDCLWRAERLIVELDGYAFHSSRAMFESDRRRDRSLALLGFEVMRFTSLDVGKRPLECVSCVRGLLRRR